MGQGGGDAPTWRGDGKEIYYVAPDGKMMAVPIGSLAPPVIGAPKALFDAGIDAASFGYDVTADGRRFLLTGAGVQPASGSIEVLVNWGALLNAAPAGH